MTSRVYAKKLGERSAIRVGLPAGITTIAMIVVENLLAVTGVLDIPKPWDQIIPIVLGMIVAIVKVLEEQSHSPSVSASQIPGTVEVLNRKGDRIL